MTRRTGREEDQKIPRAHVGAVVHRKPAAMSPKRTRPGWRSSSVPRNANRAPSGDHGWRGATERAYGSFVVLSSAPSSRAFQNLAPIAYPASPLNAIV